MSETVWAVDGSFFAQRLSGIQRYSIELLAALDRIVPPGLVEIVTPQGVETPPYTNIKTVPFGTHKGGVWQQLDYPRYLKQRGAKGLATCNVIPLFGFRGIAVVHDVCYRARPDFYTNPRGRLSAAWHRLQYRRIAKKAERIITVSEFSKSEITKYYGVPASEIEVVYNAWQQMERITPDDSIFAAYPQLKAGAYYFSMANLLKNKNFPWVLRAAKARPDAVFAIAGGGSLAAQAERLGLADLPNVLYLGYVSDGAAKALMARCRAFLFPTLYEGFGIPPLEAAACGAPEIIVSDRRWTGYNMVFYLAGLQNIDYSIYEAARIDGASPLQQFIHLTIPLLKPTILLTAIMSTSGTLQLFDESVNLTAGGPGKATMTLTHYIYNISFVETPKFNYAAALSVFILVVVAVLSAIQMKVGDKRD